MADRILKPDSGNDLLLQNNGNTSSIKINDDQSIDVTLGTSSGDDFAINSTHLVVEGDTGNVGIGTTDPSSIFEIVDASSPQLRIKDSTNDHIVGMQSYDTAANVGTISNTRFDIISNNSERITIAAAGKVGIGTTAPAYPFHVVTSLDADYAGLIHNTDADNGQGLMIRAGADSGDAILSLRDQASSAKMTVLANGNVGIGTTAPADLFHCHGADKTAGSLEGNIRVSTSDSYAIDKGGQIALGGAYHNNGAISMYGTIAGRKENGTDQNYAGYLQFGTRTHGGNLAERMRIDSSGNVGIGTTSPAHNIDVVGTAGLTTGTAWTNTSDERIKTNIKPIENALEKIKLLRPVSFNYSKDYLDQHSELSDSKTYNSFIAQEYATVFPDAVNAGGNLEKITVESVEAKEAVLDKDGNEISPAVEAVEEVREIIVEDMLQFTPHDLNMYLVGAVKELSAKVTALENA